MKTQKKSSQVVLSRKVPLFEKGELDRPIFILISGFGTVAAAISGTIGVQYIHEIDMSNYITMGIIEASIMTATGGFFYAKNTITELSRTGTYKFKDYLKMMNPLKSKVTLTSKPIPMELSGITENSKAPYLAYNLKNKLSADTTHEITAQLTKTLKGVRVEQIIEEVPGETWDKAFDSVSRIHEFEK